MDLKQIWEKRENRRMKKMVKYFQYIFNDHFVLFLFILFGGLIYSYAQFIKTIDVQQEWPLLLTALLLTLAVFFGQISTLLMPADKVFLTPLEEKMDGLLNRLRWRSMLLPSLFLIAVSLLVVPLLVAYDIMLFAQFWQLSLVLILLKAGEMLSQQAMMKEWGRSWKFQRALIHAFIFLAVFLIFIYVSPWLAVIFSGLYFLSWIFYYRSSFRSKRWNWEYMIELEQSRLKRQLNIINLFTDVPEIQSQAKRRKILDPLIDAFPKSQHHPALFLMVRSFFRHAEYFNLYLRLSLLGVILICLSPYLWLRLILGLIFIYLIGFQLIPLTFLYRKSQLRAVFPVPDDMHQQAISTFLTYVLLAVSLLFGLFGFWNTGHWAVSFMNMVLYMLFSYLFAHYYVQWRMKDR